MRTILGICGSLNAGSANARLLDLATELAPAGVAVVRSTSVEDLPHFRPDVEAPPDGPVARFRAEIGAADGVVIATPEYAHALPGALKDALDWVVGSGELYGRRVAILSAAPAPERGANAREMLERTLRAQGAHVVLSETLVERTLDLLAEDVLVEDVHPRQQVHAVHARQVEVEDDQVGLVLAHQVEPGVAVVGLADDFELGVLGEQRANRQAHGRVILHHDDAFVHGQSFKARSAQ